MAAFPFRTVSTQFVELQGDVSGAIQSMTETVNAANALIDDVGTDITRMTATSARLLENVEDVSAETGRIVAGTGLTLARDGAAHPIAAEGYEHFA